MVPNEETLANERNDKQTPKKKNQLKDKQQILELERKLDELPEYLRESVKEDIKKDKVQECYPGFHIACSLSQGEGFGELAFQKNEDKYVNKTSYFLSFL